MRALAGAVLIAAAEQAFAHSQLVQFPNHLFASEVLLPSSGILLLIGLALLIWGVLTDRREPLHLSKQDDGDTSRSSK
jgi:membrane-bound ClpP family serine protease